jgi:hypothetical protein
MLINGFSFFAIHLGVILTNKHVPSNTRKNRPTDGLTVELTFTVINNFLDNYFIILTVPSLRGAAFG